MKPNLMTEMDLEIMAEIQEAMEMEIVGEEVEEVMIAAMKCKVIMTISTSGIGLMMTI
jgi:hypothetical protein